MARVSRDRVFWTGIVGLSSAYVLLLVAMLAANASFTSLFDIRAALGREEIRHALVLSLLTCSITAICSVIVAVPIGYLMSRVQFRGKSFLDAFLDVPIVLPPLVVGLSLLILFQTAPGQAFESILPVTYRVPSIILAQFVVACAFAIRTLRVTFDRIDPRHEDVALTLGASRTRAFFSVVLPEARGGVVAAGTLAWARAMGEFGPVLVFSGVTRMRTEVLPTSVFLELSIGNIEAAVAISFLMITVAILAMMLARWLGERQGAES